MTLLPIAFAAVAALSIDGARGLGPGDSL